MLIGLVDNPGFLAFNRGMATEPEFNEPFGPEDTDAQEKLRIERNKLRSIFQSQQSQAAHQSHLSAEQEKLEKEIRRYRGENPDEIDNPQPPDDV